VKVVLLHNHKVTGERFVNNIPEDLGDDDIALGPHLEVKTCDQFWMKTIIRQSDSTETGHRLLPQSVVLERCRRLQDLLVRQGTTKSTRKKTQEVKK